MANGLSALPSRQGIRYRRHLIAAPYPYRFPGWLSRMLFQCLEVPFFTIDDFVLYYHFRYLSIFGCEPLIPVSFTISSARPVSNPAIQTTKSTVAAGSSTRRPHRDNFNYPSMLQVAAPPSERSRRPHLLPNPQPRQQSSHPPITISVTKPSTDSADSLEQHKYDSGQLPALAALASLAASAPAAPVKRENERWVL